MKDDKIDANAYNSLELPDGRFLGFALFGDLDGYPALYFHGWPGSRFEAGLLNEIALEAGVKLIGVDRPGIGLSSKLEDRTLLDWPADISNLLDYLEISRCIIIGHSGGAPYAYACVYTLPQDRISALIISSGVGPIEFGTEKMKFVLRLGLHLAKTCPNLLKFLLRILFYPNFKTLKRAKRTSKIYNSTIPKREKVCIESKEAAEMFIQTNYNAYIQDELGTFQDLVIYATNWGFKLEDIPKNIPLFLLHGEKDMVIPIRIAKSAVRSLLHSYPYIYPEKGHFSTPYHHLGEILGQILKEYC